MKEEILFRRAALLAANYRPFARGERIAFAAVQSCMFLWCLRGKGEVTANGVVCPLEPGAFVFLPWLHAIVYRADSASPYLLGNCHVIPHCTETSPERYSVRHAKSGTIAPDPRRRNTPDPRLQRVLFGNLETAPELEHLAHFAVRWYGRGAGAMRTARELGRLLLSELVRAAEHAPDARAPMPGRLRTMLRHIRVHRARSITPRDLAGAANCSPSTVCRLFRCYLDATPSEYLRRMRMERAAALLNTTDLSVAAVGRAVGVADPYYFSKLFKAWHGISASRYRRRTALP
ncbi:MAG: helix-turn-helix transcriptional regulator [Kiritimatiellae bacterium]|nr:helix-turn-helix transcriptional regulator [Kiritimatiellia bacterium]